MDIRPSFDNLTEWLAAKPAGHFVIQRRGNRWAISVHHPTEGTETVFADSPGQLNRIWQMLSDEGMCGYVSGGA